MVDCKRKPKKFWQYSNQKTKSKTNVGDIKWCNRNGNDKHYEKLCQLKTGKSPGPDQLHPRTLYETQDVLVVVVVLVLNAGQLTSMFSSS